MIRFCYFHFISVLLSLPNGSVFCLTNNGLRRRGKVRGFLRRGHIIPFRPRSCPPFSLRRRIIGRVCASLAVPSGAYLTARLSPRHRGKVHTRSIPVGRVYSVVNEQEGKRSPQLRWTKKRHFHKQISKKVWNLHLVHNCRLMSPHFCSRKNRHFGNQIPNVLLFFTKSVIIPLFFQIISSILAT